VVGEGWRTWREWGEAARAVAEPPESTAPPSTRARRRRRRGRRRRQVDVHQVAAGGQGFEAGERRRDAPEQGLDPEARLGGRLAEEGARVPRASVALLHRDLGRGVGVAAAARPPAPPPPSRPPPRLTWRASTRSDLLPTSAMTTSAPRSARTCESGREERVRVGVGVKVGALHPHPHPRPPPHPPPPTPHLLDPARRVQERLAGRHVVHDDGGGRVPDVGGDEGAEPLLGRGRGRGGVGLGLGRGVARRGAGRGGGARAAPPPGRGAAPGGAGGGAGGGGGGGRGGGAPPPPPPPPPAPAPPCPTAAGAPCGPPGRPFWTGNRCRSSPGSWPRTCHTWGRGAEGRGDGRGRGGPPPPARAPAASPLHGHEAGDDAGLADGLVAQEDLRARVARVGVRRARAAGAAPASASLDAAPAAPRGHPITRRPAAGGCARASRRAIAGAPRRAPPPRRRDAPAAQEARPRPPPWPTSLYLARDAAIAAPAIAARLQPV